MRRINTIAICALLLCPSLLRADAVDDYISAEIVKRHIPGLSLGVILDGKLVKARGFGLANIELSVPAEVDTVYLVGSITKQFTAVGIMMLCEEGKIGLDDPIKKYLDGVPAGWSRVTVRQLLTHTSGIPNSTELKDWDRLAMFPATLVAMTDACSKDPLRFDPGQKWEYCNTGYYLLGRIIEKVSGEPYSAFLSRRIFGPLAMDQTRIDDPQQIIPGRAAGYVWRRNAQHNAGYFDLTWLDSAGALVSSVSDLVKWDAAIERETILRHESWQQMWMPVKFNNGRTYDYGFAFFLHSDKGHRWVSHDGRLGGFTSYYCRHPDEKISVVVLTNQLNAKPSRIAAHVAGLYVPSLMPPPYKPIEDKDPKIAQMVKDYYAHLAGGDLGPAPFEAKYWLDLKKQIDDRGAAARSFGALGAIELVEQSKDQDNRVLRYRVRFAKSTRITAITLNGDEKVSDIRDDEE